MFFRSLQCLFYLKTFISCQKGLVVPKSKLSIKIMQKMTSLISVIALSSQQNPELLVATRAPSGVIFCRILSGVQKTSWEIFTVWKRVPIFKKSFKSTYTG